MTNKITPAVTGDVERLKADLKDEINFDVNTRINKVSESVVDQVVDILTQRGLLSFVALPPSSGWEAGAEAMKMAAVNTAIREAGIFHGVVAAIRALPLPLPPSKEDSCTTSK